MYHTHEIEILYLLANSRSVYVGCSLRMAFLISSGIANHRLSIRGFGSLNGVTVPTIFCIDSLVNPNLASVLIFQLVDLAFEVASEVWPEGESILEPEFDVGIGSWCIAHGFRMSLICFARSPGAFLSKHSIHRNESSVARCWCFVLSS